MKATLKSFNYLSVINNPHHRHLHNSTILSSLNSVFRFFRSNHLFSTQCGSLMEVCKAVFSQGSNACDRVAIKADGMSYSYAQLTSSALTISQLFHNENGGETRKYGSLQGARVGIVAKPSAEFVAGVLGTWFSGGVAVPLALSYPEAELLYVMSNSDISVLLSTEDHSETMKTIAAKSNARFLLIPPLLNSTSETVTNNQFQDDSFQEDGKLLDDPALIVYTSGYNCTHLSLQWLWEYTSADHFLHCLPLHHVHAFLTLYLLLFTLGLRLSFYPNLVLVESAQMA
ncbi:Malonate--CoA ligase [Raphanus sativus]|nr:Malonate--CoA ligase [Raphanus sativus]